MKKFLLLIPVMLSALIENSVVEQVNEYHRGNHLKLDRYASEQLEELRAIFGRRHETVRILSFNILFNTHDRQLPSEHRWPERKFRVIEYLKFADPDIICCQEPMKNQIQDLQRAIGLEYSFFGVGQSDGGSVGEVSGIFYRKDRFTVLDEQVLFMALNSERVSTGPLHPGDRALTMLVLRDDQSGRPLALFNTHFPLKEIDARVTHARFIAEHVEGLTERMPVVLCGDFNTFPNRPDITGLPYHDGDYVQNILTSGSLRDTFQTCLLGHVGPLSTYTNTSQDDVRPFEGTGTPGVVLDHIFLGGKATPVIHAHDPVRVDGHYPSDHMPIFVDILLQ